VTVVRVQCPHCKRRYRTKIEAFGRTAVCTKCSQTFKIGEARPPFEWQATDLAEDSWIGVPEPEEKKEMKHCIICDAPLLPDTVRCPECGTNQVTGLVHKSRRTRSAEESTIWSVIPFRLIGILLGIAILGAGVFWGVQCITRQSVQMGDELADAAMLSRVTKELERGEDEREIALNYAGYVKDSNLPRFTEMLAGNDARRRQAAMLLIATGQATRLDPLLAAARGDDPQAADASLATLWTIGPRRLVELSSHEDEAVRKTAVQALALIFDLDVNDTRVAQLSRPDPAPRKILLLNEICRPWPELVGSFVVTIGETSSPFTVEIEQIGKAFYLKAGNEEFITSRGDQRFDIPIHRWCTATGSAVDGRSVRQMMSGSVTLAARAGAIWEGQVAITLARVGPGPLPGFLPLDATAPGRRIEAPLHLERPARRTP